MASKKVSVAGVPGVDPTLPRVPLVLNGKTYYLHFSFNAIATAEELTGLNILDSMDLQNLNAIKYRALLYSTLLQEDPSITLERVGNMISLATLPAITVALVHEWTGSNPEIVEAAKDEKANPTEE